MPPPGFCAITVAEEWFNRFDAIYKAHKKNGTLNPSICSFASFFTEQLDIEIKQKNAMRDIINMIKYVPAKFTETKLTIKISKP